MVPDLDDLDCLADLAVLADLVVLAVLRLISYGGILLFDVEFGCRNMIFW